MKTQIENDLTNEITSILDNLGWTWEIIETSDFWTTIETDCDEDEFNSILNNL